MSLGSLTTYPAPAVGKAANSDNDATTKSNHVQQQNLQATAGTLPDDAATVSNAARGLLMRLLERDPRVRMRNLRQLQQSAFYMGFNFEHVKAKKVSPKSVLEKYFPNDIAGEESLSNDFCINNEEVFLAFDQPTLV